MLSASATAELQTDKNPATELLETRHVKDPIFIYEG
jgi:hypothetical protein